VGGRVARAHAQLDQLEHAGPLIGVGQRGRERLDRGARVLARAEERTQPRTSALVQGALVERTTVELDRAPGRLLVLAVDVAEAGQVIGAALRVDLCLDGVAEQLDDVAHAVGGGAQVDEGVDRLCVGAERLLDAAPHLDGALQPEQLGLVDARDAREIFPACRRLGAGRCPALQVFDQGGPALRALEDRDARVEGAQIALAHLQAALPQAEGAIDVAQPIGEARCLGQHLPLAAQVRFERRQALEHAEQAFVLLGLAEQLTQAPRHEQARHVDGLRVVEHAQVQLDGAGLVSDPRFGDLARLDQNVDAPLVE
jgi:hypothetical protein